MIGKVSDTDDNGVGMAPSGQYTGRWLWCAALVVLLLFILVGFGWGLAGRLGVLQGSITAALRLGEDWSDNAVEESQRRGELIITAIKRYQTRNGKLPPTLKALVPKDINRIEPPAAGNLQWRYGALGSYPEEFFLLVESEYCDKPNYYGVEWFRYTSLDKKWNAFNDESLLFN